MKVEEFTWLKESSYVVREGGLELEATPKSDYFVNPETEEATLSAPFLYHEVEGDFVFRAKVSHGFTSVYDACVLLAYDHERLWAKACFELSDLGTHNVVSVMTNGVSDDANNVCIEGNEVWLQLARKGSLFAVHYSLDGERFQMARLTRLPMRECIKVGFEAQSPIGEGGKRVFEDIVLECRTLDDIRDGNF